MREITFAYDLSLVKLTYKFFFNMYIYSLIANSDKLI